MERVLVPTGLAIELPGAHSVALVYARSGLSIKHGLCMANGVGVVDSDYRGELKVPMINLARRPTPSSPGSGWHSCASPRCTRQPLCRCRNWATPPAARAVLAPPANERKGTRYGTDLSLRQPRRRELLSLYTTDFTVCVSDLTRAP